jgi:hypothetical protein
MYTRVVIQLLLLPLVLIGVPLMFSLAWLHEAIDDFKVRAQPPTV